MNREDLIRMAHESWLDVYGLGKDYPKFIDACDRFIKIEQEAIAELVEKMGMEGYGTLAIAAAIRARSKE